MAENKAIDPCGSGKRTVTYFVAKCKNNAALKKCCHTGIWACRDRAIPPHPRCFLTDAMKTGGVILIFSVNNCHGWHGYCEMIDIPGTFEPSDKSIDTKSESEETQTDTQKYEELEQSKETTAWHYFQVKWKVCFAKQFGEQCLSSKTTEDFISSDNTAVNKSRNWQEVSCDIGKKICFLIDNEYEKLCKQQQEKEEAKLAKKIPSFFTKDLDERSGTRIYWPIVSKVEKELGKVHLACPFGSQRYNLDGPASDIDVFVVYQAATKDMLSFDPPKQTFKNSNHDVCDYTILEIHRYMELLLSGDPRCVETLFLHDSTVISSSNEWRQLQHKRQILLTRQCLDKYLRDALGSNGVKQLQRWHAENTDVRDLPPKISKLVYIIVRLLQNARDIVTSGKLKIFRKDESDERQTLMAIREGKLCFSKVWRLIESLREEIDDGKDKLVKDSSQSKLDLENWLLQLRYTDFFNNPPSGANISREPNVCVSYWPHT